MKTVYLDCLACIDSDYRYPLLNMLLLVLRDMRSSEIRSVIGTIFNEASMTEVNTYVPCGRLLSGSYRSLSGSKQTQHGLVDDLSARATVFGILDKAGSNHMAFG